MSTTINKLLVLGIILFTLLLPLSVNAQDKSNLCTGANLELVNQPGNDCAVQEGNTKVSAESKLNAFIKTITNLFSLIVGVVAIIMILYGGFRYVTSGGDSNSISAAKNTLIYAVVGLIVVALAQIIVKFVLARATGVNLKE